jgi:hypothetical protein
VNASQSFQFSEERRFPDAWNGCGLVDLFQGKWAIARKSGTTPFFDRCLNPRIEFRTISDRFLLTSLYLRLARFTFFWEF